MSALTSPTQPLGDSAEHKAAHNEHDHKFYDVALSEENLDPQLGEQDLENTMNSFSTNTATSQTSRLALFSDKPIEQPRMPCSGQLQGLEADSVVDCRESKPIHAEADGSQRIESNFYRALPPSKQSAVEENFQRRTDNGTDQGCLSLAERHRTNQAGNQPEFEEGNAAGGFDVNMPAPIQSTSIQSEPTNSTRYGARTTCTFQGVQDMNSSRENSQDVLELASADIRASSDSLSPRETSNLESPEAAERQSLEEPDMEKLKAAQAARRRQRRPLSNSMQSVGFGQSSKSSSSPDVPNALSSTNIQSITAQPDEACTSGSSEQLEAIKQVHEQQICELKQAHAVELQSIHRNHLENLRKMREQRDMFAEQLAKEQSESEASVAGTKQIDAYKAQLRVARIRGAELQGENTKLLDKVKQLMLLVQAQTTQRAEAASFDAVVQELVSIKLRCAQLEEENEDFRRLAREASSAVNLLKSANGDLEKSRAEWVRQCSNLEQSVKELEKEKETLANERAGSKAYRPHAARRPQSTSALEGTINGLSLS